MNTIRIKQVDAFTRRPFSGNPAAVVTDAAHLSSKEMQKIAREMNLSETVFVLPAEDPETADCRLRWFTPYHEVDLCGHATIAAFHVLAEEGQFELEVDEPQTFIIETRSGKLEVDVEWKDLIPFIKFSLPIPQFFPYPGDLGNLAGSLGLADVEFSSKVKPQISESGYCYVPLKSADSLNEVEANPILLKKLYEKHNITGFALFATDLEDKDADWEMRFFAPALGVDEDPVTGSANGPLAAFLYRNNLLEHGKHYFTFKGTQGAHVGRPGTVYVGMATESDEIKELHIAGHAITMMEGNLIVSNDSKVNL